MMVLIAFEKQINEIAHLSDRICMDEVFVQYKLLLTLHQYLLYTLFYAQISR